MWSSRDAYYTCSDGQVYVPGEHGRKPVRSLILRIADTLKGRSLSRRVIEESSNLYLDLAGTIPKHGSPPATIVGGCNL